MLKEFLNDFLLLEGIDRKMRTKRKNDWCMRGSACLPSS